MTNQIACQHCQFILPIPISYSGRKVRCPKCAKSFVVPTNSPEVTQEIQVTRDTEVHTPKPPRPTSPPPSNPKPSAEGTNGAAKIFGKIGRFELREILGQGGFGRVYRAYDPQLDREVALKVPTFGPQDKHKINRFLTEAKAAAGLRHPHIVPTFESGLVDGRYYIATQYVKGKTLSQTIKGTLRPPEQAVRIVVSIARALAYAHHEGIVHRDIKPENIMLDGRGEPQLMDFGLAKRLNEDSGVTTDGTLMGTPAYMSPEQARADTANVGPRSDQYAVGAILYELLCGKRAFDGPPHSVLAQILTNEPQPIRTINAEVPKDIEAIAQKAMCKEASGRYPSCGELADDLERWLRGETTLARPATIVERMTRWSRRNKTLAMLSAGTAAVILVAVVGISLALFQAELQKNRAEATEAASQKEIARREMLRAQELASKLAETAYAQLIRNAYSAYEVGYPVYAKTQLVNIDARFRNWEYHLLLNNLNSHWQELIANGKYRQSKYGHDFQFLPTGGYICCTGIDNRNGSNFLLSYDIGKQDFTRSILTHNRPETENVSGSGVIVMDRNGSRFLSMNYHYNEIVLIEYPSGVVLDKQKTKNYAGYYSEIWMNDDFTEGTIAGPNINLPPTKIEIVDGKITLTPNSSHNNWSSLTEELKVMQAKHKKGYFIRPTVDHAAFFSDGNAFHQLLRLEGNSVVKKSVNLPANCGRITSMAINHAGSELAFGTEDHLVYVWSIQRGELLSTLKIHENPIHKLDFSPDDHFLLSAADSLVSGSLGYQRLYLNSTSWPPNQVIIKDSTTIINIAARTRKDSQPELYYVTNDDQMFIQDLQATAGRNHAQPRKCRDLVHIVWSADFLHYGGYNKTSKCIEVYQYDDDSLPRAKISVPELSTNPSWNASNYNPRMGGIAFDVDAKIVIVSVYRHASYRTGKHDANHFAYDFDGKVLWTNNNNLNYPPTISFRKKFASLNGSTFVIVGMHEGEEISRSVGKLLSFANNNLNWIAIYGRGMRCADLGEGIKLYGHTKDVTHAVFSKDDTRVFTGSKDGTVRIWDTANGEELLTLCDFGEPVGGICLAKDSTLLIAASESGKLKYFDASERKTEPSVQTSK